MPAHVLSLREPRFGSPVAAEVLGDVTVAAVGALLEPWARAHQSTRGTA